MKFKRKITIDALKFDFEFKPTHLIGYFDSITEVFCPIIAVASNDVWSTFNMWQERVPSLRWMVYEVNEVR